LKKSLLKKFENITNCRREGGREGGRGGRVENCHSNEFWNEFLSEAINEVDGLRQKLSVDVAIVVLGSSILIISKAKK
jgi:hypothetical protein